MRGWGVRIEWVGEYRDGMSTIERVCIGIERVCDSINMLCLVSIGWVGIDRVCLD